MSTATKERPILMSGPMVRAILEGRKSQTRREVKMGRLVWAPGADINRDEIARWAAVDGGPWWRAYPPKYNVQLASTSCPYGVPGDRLWVREAFHITSFGAGVAQISYAADGARGPAQGVSDHKLPETCRKVPSIHMPRHCCRLVLEITAVRVERLQDICEADAWAEGVEFVSMPPVTAVTQFEELWESLHGTGSWQQNPWVWVLEFTRTEAEQQ